MTLEKLLSMNVIGENFRLFAGNKKVGEGLRIFNRPITKELMISKGVDPKYMEYEVREVLGYSANCVTIDLNEKVGDNKPTLEEIKRVLQYLDEEMLVEGSFDEVCEYINTLKEIK